MKRLPNSSIPQYQSPLEARKQAKLSSRKKYVFRRLTIFLGAFGFLMMLILATIVQQVITIQQKQDESLQLQKEYALLKEKEQILQEEIIRLGDDEYIAKLARKEYFLSQEGEIIFNLPDESEK